ncbi:MAG: DEAD/DEAH box helicase family protein [bacterium]|nr:DEAD/DEAH box helicase family protein [bacterium]
MNNSLIHRKRYWLAQGLIQQVLSQFKAALQANNIKKQRVAFYRLSFYYIRTLHIINTSLKPDNEDIIKASLHNLLALHRAMVYMHKATPDHVPMPLPLSEEDRHEFIRDIIMRVLTITSSPLSQETVQERVSYLDMLGDVSQVIINDHLKQLIQMDFIEEQDGNFQKTNKNYIELDIDTMSLRAVVGAEIYSQLKDEGILGWHNIKLQPKEFTAVLNNILNTKTNETARLITEIGYTIRHTTMRESGDWHHADLIHSPYPRPYQREAFAAFRCHDYSNVIVESPAGSGKTMIGMMCIQDWLTAMQSGQSILVLVPTINYQQQWIQELSYLPHGLQFSPEHIFSGTPSQFEKHQQLTGHHPAIILFTYTALSQLGSSKGKGGFDKESIEIFLQAANVNYVILDEVHKVVEDMQSVSTAIAQLLVEWQNDTLLRGLIGFSGTAEIYRHHFDDCNLSLIHSISLDDLVAAGFVAPFGEIGIPFADSTRERKIRNLLNDYKSTLQSYYKALNPVQLRQWFATCPLEERMQIGHKILGLYHNRSDWQAAIQKRFKEWENGKSDNISFTEIKMITMLQIIKQWSDQELALHAGMKTTVFREKLQQFDCIREKLKPLIILTKLNKNLNASSFGKNFDYQSIAQCFDLSYAKRQECVTTAISSTFTGLYEDLSTWYFHVGEGHVETIEAIIAAEKSSRNVSGIIIFDRGRKINWKDEMAVPSYEGVGGLFAHMLRDSEFTGIAVLSNEMYLTYNPADPLTEKIAAYIENEHMQIVIGEAILNLIIQGLQLPEDFSVQLKNEFTSKLRDYIPTLKKIHSARHADFSRQVLKPLRQFIIKENLEIIGDQLLARLSPQNFHLTNLVQTFFDYSIISRHFREAHIANLSFPNGEKGKFCVVPMGGNKRRKQLIYELTSHIVDSDTLPVNLVIVSEWTRTGWNVRQPNVLIDATATRNVVAWEQLRGRALRALPTWSNDCYCLTMIINGHHLHHPDYNEVNSNIELSLDKNLLKLLKSVATRSQMQKIIEHGLFNLDEKTRHEITVRLMQKQNKVTHIYELLTAYGTSNQLTYNRSEKTWCRRKSIAAKHQHETSVSIEDGLKSQSHSHAPIIYANDPRTDLPPQLQTELEAKLNNSDKVIISGWL